jgi:hypothetical protein
MASLTPALLLVVAIAAIVGAGVGFAVTWWVANVRLRDANARIERALNARAHANDLLVQARRQVEKLQKELALARRERPAAVRPPPAPTLPAQAADDDEHERPAHGFAPTMPFKP